jgi:hypothetical protein
VRPRRRAVPAVSGATATGRRGTGGTRRSTERRVVMAEKVSHAHAASPVTGCRPSLTEPPVLVARWPDRIKRPESGGGYLLPQRGGEIDSPAAPLLLRDTPRKKWNTPASVGV